MPADSQGGSRPWSKSGCLGNLALFFASLLLALVVCEIGARILLPRPQTVRIENITTTDAVYEPKKTEESGHIDTVLL